MALARGLRPRCQWATLAPLVDRQAAARNRQVAAAVAVKTPSPALDRRIYFFYALRRRRCHLQVTAFPAESATQRRLRTVSRPPLVDPQEATSPHVFCRVGLPTVRQADF